MADKKEIFLKTKDHAVSGEEFNLMYDKNYELLETYPKPSVSEIGKYYKSENYISHTDARKALTDKLYQWVKKYTLTKKLKLINSLTRTEKTVLDIGCGTGDFLVRCKKDNWSVAGVEPGRNARKRAQQKLGQESSETIVDALEQLGTAKYQVITLWHVLEHVHDVFEYIDLIKKRLKEDGRLVIAVPNYNSYDARYYKDYWAAYDTPRHLWHFSQTAIKRIFREKNMQLHKTIPMPFDAFYAALLSEKYKSRKTNFLKAFFIGLLSNFKALSTKEFSSLIYVLKMPKNGF